MIESLNAAVAETLEALAFMEVLPGDETEGDAGQCASEALWAGIDILEPCQVRLAICVPVQLAREIVVELFGLDSPEDAGQEMLLDAMAEIINTIAGRLMTSRLGPEQTLALGLPETGMGVLREDWDVTIFFMAGDFRFMVKIRGNLT
ncbi:MAG: chemotaxis protein CheX [Pseudomonadota bacterium]